MRFSKPNREGTKREHGSTASPGTGVRPVVSLGQRRSVLAVLIALALFYHGAGYFVLFTEHPPTLFVNQPRAAFDLRFRWMEAQTIWRGHSRSANQGHYVALENDLRELRHDDGTLQPRVKVPFLGGYPPWTFFFGSLFLWSDWTASRVMFGLLNIAATIVLGYWAWGAGRRVDVATARLCLCAVLALSAHLNVLVRGQMGTIIVAAVIIAGWALDRGRLFNCGLSLSIMMVKPTMGFAFLMHFVCRRAWLPLVVMSLLLLVGTAVILVISGCSPGQVLEGLEGAGVHAFRHVPSAEIILIQAGLHPRWAVIALAVLGVGLGLVLMQKYANGAWLEQLAMAAVIGRLTGYHRAVDNVMLVFLLVLLAVRACENPRSRFLAGLFLAVGLSLWVPVRANWMIPQFIGVVLWPAALAALLIHQRRVPPMDKQEQLPLDQHATEECVSTAG